MQYCHSSESCVTVLPYTAATASSNDVYFHSSRYSSPMRQSPYVVPRKRTMAPPIG